MQCFGTADRRQLFDFSTRWRWRQDARCSSQGKRILIESVLEVPVIPAKAGIQVALLYVNCLEAICMDSRFRGNDGLSGHPKLECVYPAVVPTNHPRPVPAGGATILGSALKYLSPDPPKGGALALTQGLMGKERRTIQARFQ